MNDVEIQILKRVSELCREASEALEPLDSFRLKVALEIAQIECLKQLADFENELSPDDHQS